MSLLSENRTLDFKISDKAIELSILWVGKGEMEGKTPDLRLRDFEISQYIYVNTNFIQDNSDTWVEEENFEPDQSLPRQREYKLIFIPFC